MACHTAATPLPNPIGWSPPNPGISATVQIFALLLAAFGVWETNR